MSAVPGPPRGRNVTWQLALSLVGSARVQVFELRVPPIEPEGVRVTIPVGGVGLASVSVTVAVQVEA